MPKTTHDFGLKTSIQTFYAFVRCTLMGNQPWPQLHNGIRERSIGYTDTRFNDENDRGLDLDKCKLYCQYKEEAKTLPLNMDLNLNNE